jgi:hypothetical protein
MWDIVIRRVLVVTVVLESFATASCTMGCGYRTIERVPSPDGQRVAVVYSLACPTTSVLVNVSVLPASETELTGRGNVFSADSNHGAARLTKEGIPWATVSWTGATEILIRYDDRERVVTQETRKGDVVVRYETRDI